MKAGENREKQQFFDRKEYCVFCGKITEIAEEQPIAKREYYIEGAGQLCGKCYREIYAPRHKEGMVQLKY